MTDDVDLALISELQRDGRRSSAGIAKAVGMSEAAVRQRVRRMIGSGEVRIVAVTNPQSLGFARRARIGIRCTGDTTRLADQLANLFAVNQVILTAGCFDAIIEVECADDRALLALVDQELRALPEVHSIEIMVILKVVKQNGRSARRV